VPIFLRLVQTSQSVRLGKKHLKIYVPERNALQSLSVSIVHFRVKVKSTDLPTVKSIKRNCEELFRIDRQPVFLQNYLENETFYKIINQEIF